MSDNEHFLREYEEAERLWREGKITAAEKAARLMVVCAQDFLYDSEVERCRTPAKKKEL